MLLTDNIGIELEVENVILSRVNVPDLFFGTHDASCESNTTILGKLNNVHNIKYSASSIITNQQKRNTITGGEYVTKHPLVYSRESTEPLESSLDELIKILVDSGEPPFSYRGSLHCHVNYPVLGSRDVLTKLKNTVILGAHLEEMFFHLGGMGGIFRGVKVNNSIYCRPITGKGPQIIHTICDSELKRAQVFNIPDLLAATSVDKFFKRLGNTPVSREVERYHPARYCWLNMYSILLHKTLEFRVFNKSLNSKLITSVVKLCQEVTNDLLLNRTELLDLEPNSIFDSKDSTKSLKLLDRYLSSLPKLQYLSPKDVDLLMFVIARSGLRGSDFKNKYVYTHLKRFDETSDRYLYSNEEEYCPEEITETPIKSNFIDIHNMYGGR